MTRLRSTYAKIPFLFILLGVFILLNTSCNKDRNTKPLADEDSIYYFINEIMHSWYYWYKEVPDINYLQFNEPAELLDALVYKPIDKWSFVERAEVIDAWFGEGITFGFGFQMRYDPDGNLRVLYVYDNTDAYNSGIRKGFIVQSINGTPVSLFNDFDTFFDDSPATFSFEFRDYDNQLLSVSLEKSEVTQNAVFYENTFDVMGHNTGYLVYDSFLEYSWEELEAALNFFKENNIEELVIDLRYNQGGSILNAIRLIDALVPPENVGHTMFSYTHNDLAAPYYDTTINIEASELNLDLERVFFLTTRFSASASELVMNSLAPYMDVFLIGTPTTGKPMGMYRFDFHEWYLYPVTTKLVNANGYGDFFDGLPVDFEAGEGLDKDWGDFTDPCLSQAIHYISFGEFDITKRYDVKEASYDVLSRKSRLGKSYLILEKP